MQGFEGYALKIPLSSILKRAWLQNFSGAAPQTPFFLPLPLLYHQNVTELSGKFGRFCIFREISWKSEPFHRHRRIAQHTLTTKNFIVTKFRTNILTKISSTKFQMR